MSPTRRAHFLSRFYLGGFTRSGRKEDRLWVTSKRQGREWQVRAEEAGHQRDLFRLEGPDVDPDELEDAFGAVENEIAPVLREVLDTKEIPQDPRKLSLLLHLPALNAARPPAEIDLLTDLSDQIIRGLIVDGLTPELHRQILKEWENSGRDTAPVKDLEALKKRISAGRVRAVMERNHLLARVVQRSAILVDLLHARNWTLLETTEHITFFISSDRPVYLMNIVNVAPGSQPRFDDPRFDVIMPLSKELCLVGNFYGSPGVGKASRRTVEFINHMTETGANDFIYSPTEVYRAISASELGPEHGEGYMSDVQNAGEK